MADDPDRPDVVMVEDDETSRTIQGGVAQRNKMSRLTNGAEKEVLALQVVVEHRLFWH